MEQNKFELRGGLVHKFGGRFELRGGLVHKVADEPESPYPGMVKLPFHDAQGRKRRINLPWLIEKIAPHSPELADELRQHLVKQDEQVTEMWVDPKSIEEDDELRAELEDAKQRKEKRR